MNARLRTLVMQLLLWGVLGLSMGLAAFMVQRRAVPQTPLGPALRVGDLALPMPRWQPAPEASDDGVLLQLLDRSGNVIRRQLTVIRSVAPLAGGIPPQGHLVIQGLGELDHVEPIEVAGYAGVLASREVATPRGRGHRALLAVSLTPEIGLIVIVTGGQDPWQDMDLLRRMAENAQRRPD